MTKYTIMLQTPRKPKADTNADVEARILGTHGASAWRVLDLPNEEHPICVVKECFKRR